MNFQSLCLSRVPQEHKTAPRVAPSSPDSEQVPGQGAGCAVEQDDKGSEKGVEGHGSHRRCWGTVRTQQPQLSPPGVPDTDASSLTSLQRASHGEGEHRRVPASTAQWAPHALQPERGGGGQGPCQGLICCCLLSATSFTYHLLSPF